MDSETLLLLANVVLAGMRGQNLARRIAVTRPDTKFAYAPGYSKEFANPKGGASSEGRFLSKPFPPDALVRRGRKTLDGA